MCCLETTNDTTSINASSKHPIYPAFCFRASPTNFAWVKLGITDIHRLERRVEFGDQGLFFYKNHPIRFVNVLGLILTRVDVPRRTIITLDDSTGATIDVVILKKEDSASSGAIPVAASKASNANENDDNDNEDKQQTQRETHQSATTNTPLNITPLTPGKLVQIKGTLSIFRSTMQINLERFFPVRDTNAEMRFLEARDKFFVRTLSVPWVLGKEEVERLRVEADEEGRRVEEEQSRVRGRGKRKAEKEERDRLRIERRWEKEEKMRENEGDVAREVGREFMERVQKRRAAGITGSFSCLDA
ncbi:hypothetical protein BJX70DRAFT_389982 [Aspergillus crustosus]